jgi:hypothetical protein
MRSQTTTTTTTLSPGRVGGSGSDVLDTADLHAGTGEGTESGLRTRAGGLGTVTCEQKGLILPFSAKFHFEI